MKLKNLIYSGLILVALTLFGCGGGGGGGSDDTVATTTLSKKLVTTGSLPAGITILGIQAEITLPSGVTVKSDDNGVLASSLQLSGVATNSSTIKGSINDNKLTIGMITTEVSHGIAVGEFATLNFDVASTAPEPLGAFTIPSVKITGYDSLTGDTVELSAAPYNLKVEWLLLAARQAAKGNCGAGTDCGDALNGRLHNAIDYRRALAAAMAAA